MVIDMGYWTKVLRRMAIFAATIIGMYLAFKLAVFYMPFLIAFLIATLIEPLIRKLMSKTKLGRKKSAILIMSIVSLIIIGLIVWGTASIISEASNLLQSLNNYFEKAYVWVQNIISYIKFDKLQISEQLGETLKASAIDFLGFVIEKVKEILTATLQVVTSLPTIGIYVGITLMATYFICIDRIYMLDQIEHHFPRTWVKKFSSHMKEILTELGSYLKAEMTLVLISFVITLVGLVLLRLLKFNINYPVIAALAIGFVDALPILGSGTVLVPWAVLTAINGDIKLAIALLVLFAIICMVRQLMEPKLVSKNIGTHPIFTLIAMYTGFKAIGIFGLLLGPILLIIFKNVFGSLIDKGVVKTIFDRT